jgi:HEPN domain-containing protein
MGIHLGFELLKNRALGFPRDARMDFENRDYDLVLFHIEQFAQLYSKYLLWRLP